MGLRKAMAHVDAQAASKRRLEKAASGLRVRMVGKRGSGATRIPRAPRYQAVKGRTRYWCRRCQRRLENDPVLREDDPRDTVTFTGAFLRHDGCGGKVALSMKAASGRKQMPAVSEAQRRYLNAKFGHAWVKEHHFDNRGPLPKRKRKRRRTDGALNRAVREADKR